MHTFQKLHVRDLIVNPLFIFILTVLKIWVETVQNLPPSLERHKRGSITFFFLKNGDEDKFLSYLSRTHLAHMEPP